MDVSAYLERLGLAGVDPARVPDLAWLTRLQAAHLGRVPFENLSVVRRQRIVLNESWLFGKIVGQHRGGFCYELNGLFARLLAELGFSVQRVAAEVYRPDGARYGPPFDHMALLVDLGGIDYLVDVGFGDSFRRPLPLPHGAGRDVSGHYRLRPAGRSSATFLLERRERDGWTPQYRFQRRPQDLADYVAMCDFHQTSPESPFVGRFVCTRATATGRITLSDQNLTITNDGKQTKRAVATDELPRLLQVHFGIRWPLKTEIEGA